MVNVLTFEYQPVYCAQLGRASIVHLTLEVAVLRVVEGMIAG